MYCTHVNTPDDQTLAYSKCKFNERKRTHRRTQSVSDAHLRVEDHLFSTVNLNEDLDTIIVTAVYLDQVMLLKLSYVYVFTDTNDCEP